MFSENYSFEDKVVVRLPKCSIDQLKDILTEDESKLLEFYLSSDIRESILTSSPSLFQACEKWAAGKAIPRKKKERLISSLRKYFIRLSSRATPFGKLAGCGVVEWGNHFKGKKESSYDSIRLDTVIIDELIAKLESFEEIRISLSYKANNSIYTLSEKIRHVETILKKGNKSYKLSETEIDDHLISILRYCTSEAKSFSELCDKLTEFPVSYDTARTYINSLIESQIIQSELTFNVTGEKWLTQAIQIISRVNDFKEKAKILGCLINIDENLTKTLTKQSYEEVVENLSLLGIHTPESVIQVDSFVDIREGIIDKEVKKSLSEVVDFLSQLYPSKIGHSLESFTQKFIERYGDSSVKLQIALDPDKGIGYPDSESSIENPLLEEVYLTPEKKSEDQILLNPTNRKIFTKYLTANRNGDFVISLGEDDLSKDLAKKTNSIPSFAIFFNIVSLNPLKVCFENATLNANNLIGRFTNGSKSIREIALKITENEKFLENGVVSAEISHLPNNRGGNVVQRSILREYEIPYLSKSTLELSKQICLEDLYLRVIDNQLYLYSKKFRKIIIPKHSSAHNFHSSPLPVYKFLCDFQNTYYKDGNIGFQGNFFNLFPFNPRVEYKNVIISPASWYLNENDLKDILNSTESNVMESVRRWRVKWNIPQLVLFHSKEDLLVDFENSISVNMFIKETKLNKVASFHEFLFTDGKRWIVDNGGAAYINECIAFAVRNKSHPKFVELINKFESVMNFSECDESEYQNHSWVYMKIYCSQGESDKILLNVLAPKVARLGEECKITSWFFIRYNDPENHIRLRLKMRSPKEKSQVINYINDLAEEAKSIGLCCKTTFDRYNRELNRYGGKAIEQLEDFFAVDSATCLKAIAYCQIESDKDTRWLICFRMIYDIISAFKFDKTHQINIIQSLSENFLDEHKVDDAGKVTLDLKFRRKHDKIDSVLKKGKLKEESLSRILEWRKEMLFATIEDVSEKLNHDNELLVELCHSLIHMCSNRLFVKDARKNEMVLYYLMKRYLISEITTKTYLHA